MRSLLRRLGGGEFLSRTAIVDLVTLLVENKKEGGRVATSLLWWNVDCKETRARDEKIDEHSNPR